MKLLGIKNKWFQWLIGILLGSLLICLLLFGAFFLYTAQLLKKESASIPIASVPNYKVQQGNDSTTWVGANYLKKVREGFYVLYVEGSPIERGAAIGALVSDLHTFQEDAFVNQLKKMIPNDRYLHFLKYFIAWFNRDIENYIPEEYRQEIYAESRYLSSKYDDLIGSPYVRILNYHAAHDIGHALQDKRFVTGCTSFAAWNKKSADGKMIVGRNFDFYVGDDFAKNKIVLAMKPDKGIPFAMVTWPGMLGAVSGMNQEGLTVTINAAKSEMPTMAKTPISILARQILQYAASLEEAIKIAESTELFVSESILVTSGKENKAILIEKSPSSMAVLTPDQDILTCANHFQTEQFKAFLPQKNQNISPVTIYRQERLNELLNGKDSLDKYAVANILRDPFGINNKPIGWGNEKALNQFIAHHAIIFEPFSKKFYVSTPPFQLGEFIGFQLDSLLTGKAYEYKNSGDIAADQSLVQRGLSQYERYKTIRNQILDYLTKYSGENNLDELVQEMIRSNPDYYESYLMAGDYYKKNGHAQQAQHYYEVAGSHELPDANMAHEIDEKIKRLKND